MSKPLTAEARAAAANLRRARKHVGEPLKAFFYTEIRNERHGGVSPATLDSALDSFKQAPDGVLDSWFKGGTQEGAAALTTILAIVGGETLLQELI